MKERGRKRRHHQAAMPSPPHLHWSSLVLLLLWCALDVPSNAEYSEALVCEGNNLQLACTDDLLLAITGAFYGRYDSTTCTGDASQVVTNTKCAFQWATNVISTKCLSQKLCNVTADGSTFGQNDPCPSERKYVTVEYTCVKESSIFSVFQTSPQELTPGSGILTSASFPSSSLSGDYSFRLAAPPNHVIYLHIGSAHLGEPDCTTHTLSLIDTSNDINMTFCHEKDLPKYDLKFNQVTVKYIVVPGTSGSDFVLGFEVRGCTTDRLPSIPNAKPATTSLGQNVTYVCDSGYTSTDDVIVICINDTWSQPKQICQRRNCGISFTIPNGQVSQNDGLYGSVATYSCISGFRLDGVKTRLCQANGKWSHPEPQCLRIVCTYPGSPSHGSAEPSVATDYPIETKITFSCEDGFVLQGSEVIVCGEDGSWDKATPLCIEINCGIPPEIANGYVIYNSSKLWSLATYICDIDTSMQGLNTTQCMANGSWTGTLPSCNTEHTTQQLTEIMSTTSPGNLVKSFESAVNRVISSTPLSTSLTTQAITYIPHKKYPDGLIPGVATLLCVIFVVMLWLAFRKYAKSSMKRSIQGSEPVPLESSTDWYDEGFTYTYSNTRVKSIPITIKPDHHGTNGYARHSLSLVLKEQNNNVKKKHKKGKRVRFMDQSTEWDNPAFENPITSLPDTVPHLVAETFASECSLTLDGEPPKDQTYYSTDL